MASHPLGPGPPCRRPNGTPPRTSTPGQLMACLRAGVIALVLLGVLALIVLY